MSGLSRFGDPARQSLIISGPSASRVGLADKRTHRASQAYRDDGTGHVRCVTLVYPGDEDAEVPAVSVLSPVGAALPGLSEGVRRQHS